MKKILFLVLVAATVIVSGCVSEEPQYKSFSDGKLNFTYPASWETLDPAGAQGAFKKEAGISKDVIVFLGNSTSELAVAEVSAGAGYYLKDPETVRREMASNEGVVSSSIIKVAGRNAAMVKAADSTTQTVFVYLKLNRTSGYAFMYSGPKNDTAFDAILETVKLE
ncbi:hypothetical protein [Methanothermobacter sp.]|uniref:hypothetical protein n=1 Tax=Methanothermobacter sp. TaxID=1884223 RepID=UPI003C756F8E